jgi:hypothetical protein
MSQNGTIIAFTCDRSGAGQTMALSSIALVLAANGRRVLAIDWDTRKPSLPRYLAPFLPSDAITNKSGLIDLLWGYASAARRAPPSDIQGLQFRFADVDPSVCAIPGELRMRNGGELHILSAGQEPKRGVRARYFSWRELFDRLHGEGLMTMLFDLLKGRYEHILLDCPPLSPPMSPLLYADIIVPCFTLDDESINAAAEIIRRATERVSGRKFLVYPLTMRVVNAELEVLDQKRKEIQRAFSGPKESEASTISHERWREAPEIPYHTYQRVLPPLIGIGSLQRVYQQFAATLSGLQDIQWTIPDEEQKAKFIADYRATESRFVTRQVHPFPFPYQGNELYLFVSYARDDRDSVMPVLQELIDLDWRLWWDEEIPGGADWRSYLSKRIEQAALVLVFLSARSGESKWVAEEIRLAHDFGRPFLSIRLDRSDLPEEVQAILGHFQMIETAATDFCEQLGRGMHFLRAPMLSG